LYSLCLTSLYYKPSLLPLILERKTKDIIYPVVNTLYSTTQYMIVYIVIAANPFVSD